MDGHNTKQVVTSIIGHEIETKFSLLDWFLNAEGQISGWSEHYWNGNTTLELIHLPMLEEIIEENRLLQMKDGVIHFKFEDNAKQWSKRKNGN